MNPSAALRNCAESRFSFGLRSPGEKLYLSWGEENDSQKKNVFSLSFRNFFPDGKKSFPGLPCQGDLHLQHFFEGIPSDFSGQEFSHTFLEKTEVPGRSEWGAYCEKIQEGISGGRFEKVVPARSETLFFSEELNPLALLENLFSKPDSRTHRFFLKWNSSVFFGATPELLLETSNENIFVPAIAGTLPFIGGLPPSDETKNRFLYDQKEREEHLLVVRGIAESLNSLGVKLEKIPEPSLMEIPGLIHIFTPIHGKRGGLSTNEIIESLHPTPAVGGYPAKIAREFLLEHEPMARGLFSAPLHFQIKDRDIVLVAIRSALLEGSSLTFYAGAGFVKQSVAEGEWKETGRKMGFLKKILEINDEIQ